MKKNVLISGIIIIGLFFFGLQKSNSTDSYVKKNDSTNIQSLPTIDKFININDKTIDWTKFDRVYAYIDTNTEFMQILGVKWHGIDTIYFHIICSSMLCDSEFDGNAILFNSKSVREINEEENDSYQVDEYLSDEINYVVSVRIDTANKSKARLIYSPKGEPDYDCDPDNQLIMKKINIR